MMKQFSNNLRYYRRKRGLTRTELGKRLGVTKQSIIDYEKGVTFPTEKGLYDIVSILNITFEQLLEEKNNEGKKQNVLHAIEQRIEHSKDNATYYLGELQSESVAEKIKVVNALMYDFERVKETIGMLCELGLITEEEEYDLQEKIIKTQNKLLEK